VHRNAVKHIFKYLKSTPNFGLSCSSDININVIGNSDADYAGGDGVTTRRSKSESVFCVGKGLIAMLHGAHIDRNQCQFLLQSRSILH